MREVKQEVGLKQATIDEIRQPDFEHKIVDPDRLRCNCGMQFERSLYWWQQHSLSVSALLAEPERLLLGEVISPHGRSTWTFWLDHVAYPTRPFWDASVYHTKQREVYQKDQVGILRAMENRRPWTKTSELFYYPWSLAIAKNLGHDIVWPYPSKPDALSYAYKIIARKAIAHGWPYKLFEDMGGELPNLNPPQPPTPLDAITDVIRKANNSSGMASHIRRLKEIDELLDQLDVLHQVRDKLYNKVTFT